MTQMTVTNTCEIINDAIVAHFLLGHQLRGAAYEQNRGLPVRAFKNSQNCGLGQLIDHLKANGQMTARATEVDALHMDLHDAACGVAALIATGHFDQAINELATGYYAEAAAALVKGLTKWKMEAA